MSPAPKAPMEELLAHSEWITRLARQLAGPGADDIVQETWIAALRSPPRAGLPVRAWLTSVLRNVVRLRWRNDTRRDRREAASQSLEADHVEGVDEVYERMDMQRFLADQVMALEESLRVVVVLRYVEGLDATQISARVGVPPGTVRWRLKLALERLREILDDRCAGNRRAWALVLAPTTMSKDLVAIGMKKKGALVMAASSKIKASVLVALALLLTVAAGTTLWWAAGRPSNSSAAVSPRHHRATGLGRGIGAGPSPTDTAGAPVGSLTGIVQRPDGSRVGRALVVAIANPSDMAMELGSRPARSLFEAVTNESGTFQMNAVAPGRYVLTASKTAVGVARSAPLEVSAREATHNVVLTLATVNAGLSGRVLDPAGGGVPGARVLAGATDGDSSLAFAAVADDEGRYQLPLPPGQYRFEAGADGYAAARFASYVRLAMLRDFRLYPASRISGRVVDRANGASLPHAEVSVVDLQSHERGMVTRTVAANHAGMFVVPNLDPSSYRLIAHAGTLVGQHPRPVVVGLAQEVSAEILLDRGRTVQGSVHLPDGGPVPDAALMVPFGPLELLASWQPGVRGATDGAGRFKLEGLPPNADVEILATSPQGKTRQSLNLVAGDIKDLRLVLAPQGQITGTVLDRDRRPVANARVIAATGQPRGPWSPVSHTDQAGRFRIRGLSAGPLTVAAIQEVGLAEVAAGQLDAGATKDIVITLGHGSSVSGTVRRHDRRAAAGVQVFAFAGGWNQTAPAWGQPTAAVETGTDGNYRFDALPATEVLIHAVNPGDDPFSGVPGRHARPDWVALALKAGDTKSGVDLVVLRNDLRITGRVTDAEGRPLSGAILNALPNGEGEALPRGRSLSQPDGQFVIEGLSDGDYAIVVAHSEYGDLRREHVRGGAQNLELRFEREGALAGHVVRANGVPAPSFRITARPIPGPNPSEPELRARWVGPASRADVLSQPDGTFQLAPVGPGTFEVVAYLPDKLVARLPAVTLRLGERQRDLRLVARPGVTIRGRVVDHVTGQPVASARIEGRGLARGLLASAVDSAGRFALDGLAPGQIADFAILSPRGDYLTDSKHLSIPAEGGTVDIGDAALFPGPAQKLTFAGQAATGLWFHTFDGRPTVYAVRPGSPAATTGVKAGDLVLTIDGKDVRTSSASVVEGLVATAASIVELGVQSSGSLRTFVIPRAEAPKE